MATKNPLKVQCPKCCGEGKIPLSPELEATLSFVKSNRRATSHQVAHKLNWKGSVAAINNRLEDLRALGLLDRERQGKFYFYFPAKH